ncbi:MAG: chemotaxis protein CheD [Desulfobacteraceae bacterium]|nr:chemotaxis protein CheD [Desulfobacteraceae bacterium]
MNNWDYRDESPRIYLKPGEVCVSTRPITVTTVLGSCISVTLYNRITHAAAICHALQPRCPKTPLCSESCPPECKGRYRFASCAIEGMSRQMLKLGALPKDLEVKLFGGAAMIGSLRPENAANSVGQQNVKAAMETLGNCGLVLKVMDVGGGFGRKIVFDTSTGDVLMKRLQRVVISEELT